MGSNRYVIGSVFATFLSVACAHQGQDSSTATTLTNPSTGEVTKKPDSDVPPELWSPERKKANASFYYLSGEYELMNRNVGGAAKLFETAYAMEPNAFVGAKLIESKSLSNFDEALTLAKKMSLLYPHNGDIQLSYGRLLAAKGAMKEAETYLRSALKMRPDNLESSVLLIQLLQAQNKTKEAIVVAKSMVEKNADFVEGWALLARLYLVNNQPEKAIDPARHAYDLNSSDIEKTHLLAVSLLLGKQTNKSLPYFDNLIKPDNFSDDSIERMLKLYEEIGAAKAYLKVFQKADRESGKKSDGLSFQMVVLEWGKQNFKDSSQILEDLANRYPQNEKLRYLLGLTRDKNGQADEALKVYLQFDVNSDMYAVTRVRAIDLLKRLGRGDDALKVAQEAIDSGSDQSVVFYSLASNILSNSDRNDQAIVLVDKGLAADPGNVELLFLKAVFLEKAKKLDESVATLKEVIKRDPKHAAALNYLGYMYAERKIHLDEAESYIKRALDEKPENGFYLDSLGWVYYQQKRYKEAVATLERALQLSSNDPTVAEHLGDAFIEVGDGPRAAAAFQLSLNGLKDPKDLERVKAKYDMAKSED